MHDQQQDPPASGTDHECEANLEIEHQIYDGEVDVSCISGAVTNEGAVIYMQCAECGQRFDAQYEFSELEPYN